MTTLDQPDALRRRLAGRLPRSARKDRPSWIFGAGGFGKGLADELRSKGYDVRGHVETTPREASCRGLPVVDWKDARLRDPGTQLIVGIFNRDMALDELAGIASAAGCAEVLLPWDACASPDVDLGWRYWLQAPGAIERNMEAIAHAWELLADGASRECLLRICAFRAGADLDYASFRHPDRQYFNALTLPPLAGRRVAYVDGGAYSGDTFADIASRADIARAYLFEPDAANFQGLAGTVRGLASGGEVACIPAGLSDHHDLVSFASGGEGATISATGTSRIPVIPLDDVLPSGRVDFIKLDVEGAESEALRGAASIIDRSRPILALSLYHRPSDAWELPAYIADRHPGYRLHIRQHFLNSFDSVLYAIPVGSEWNRK